MSGMKIVSLGFGSAIVMSSILPFHSYVKYFAAFIIFHSYVKYFALP